MRFPKKRQNLMFSATFSPEIKKLAGNFLTDPVVIEVARQNATAATIKQEVFSVNELQKTDALVELLKTRGEDPRWQTAPDNRIRQCKIDGA